MPMFPIQIAAAFVFCASLAAQPSPDSMATQNQTAKTFTTNHVSTIEVKYLEFLPKGYAADTAKKWPLMIFLHGAGERGANLPLVTVHGPPKVVKTNADFPFVLLSPQCPSGQVWRDQDILALLDHALATLRVDADRVYLTGLSMGGFGSWSLASKHPERFAAVAPICGGGAPIEIWLAGGARAEALKRLPVWAFHGAKDNVVPLEESKRMVDAFTRIGNAARLTVYAEAGHDSWTESYNNPELYEWFLKQTRSKAVK